jgi:hypothetical protein
MSSTESTRLAPDGIVPDAGSIDEKNEGETN